MLRAKIFEFQAADNRDDGNDKQFQAKLALLFDLKNVKVVYCGGSRVKRVARMQRKAKGCSGMWRYDSLIKLAAVAATDLIGVYQAMLSKRNFLQSGLWYHIESRSNPQNKCHCGQYKIC